MRAVAIGCDGRPELISVAEPTLGPNDALIDVVACGICGSDVHIVQGRHVGDGVVLGHEVAGTISAVGADVQDLAVGEPVVVQPFVPCGECTACAAGVEHLCAEGVQRGVGLGITPGGFAERLVVPSSAVLRVPAGFETEDAALTEPLAVALHGIRLAVVQPSDQIAVVGGGAIGILVALVIRARGHENLVLIEPSETRAERLSALGFEVGQPRASSADVVLECAGHPAATNSAIELAARAGTVVLLGVLHERVPISQLRVVTKELTIRGSFAYSRPDFHHALELLSSGRVRRDDVVTGTRRLSELPSVLDELCAGSTSHTKVLVRP